MMRDTAALFEWNFRCGNLNLLIDLNGIAVDDFAVEMQRNLNSEFTLAGSCWSDDRDDVAQIGNLRFIGWLTACRSVWRFFRHGKATQISNLCYCPMISRIRITSQMTRSKPSAPMI